MYIVLFSYREQVASGCHLCRSHSSRRSDLADDRSSDRPGRPDLDQSDGLEEGHIFAYEGGTLLLPPSPANAFPTLPNTRTPVTVCASRLPAGTCELRCRCVLDAHLACCCRLLFVARSCVTCFVLASRTRAFAGIMASSCKSMQFSSPAAR